MNLRRLILLGALLTLALSCTRTVEPGVYTVQGGFVRVFVDSLGNTKALMYRDTSGVWADTLSLDLKAEKPDLKPYEAPEFRLFPVNELYREPIYKVGETQDVIYGRVLRNGREEEGERMDLTMDLYVPEDGGQVARPLLVAFPGGAFRDGDKRDTTLVEWCRYFASLGYVAATVDYRQGYRRNVQSTDEAMFRALKDANAAVRFLLKRDSLLIHSERIFAAGADAGGIMAMNLAYMREENMPEIIVEEEDTTIVTRQALLRGFDVRAVANLWGAVPDTAILHNAKIPVISFQSREDPVIPFGAGHPFDEGGYEEEEPDEPEDMFDWLRSVYESIVLALVPENRHAFREMYGAGVIHRVLRRYGVSSDLNVFRGERHNLFIGEDGLVDYPVFDEIKDRTAAFFASRMVVAPVSLRQDPEDPQLFVIDNSEVETCLWDIQGGVLLGKGDDAIRVLFFPDAPEHKVSVSGEYISGLTFYETVEL
ncbi:MAG: alpha/beta hydrolase [Bacteroidales bacterium]|nr:alpha/beta hydrolase [Bacteroidales bacterium]